jgi:hypothetical protein
MAGGVIPSKPKALETVSGHIIRIVDNPGRGALSCSDQTLLAWLWPTREPCSVPTDSVLSLAAVSIRCENAESGDTLTVETNCGNSIDLNDDGSPPDQIPGDGIYWGNLKIDRDLWLKLPGARNGELLTIHNGPSPAVAPCEPDFTAGPLDKTSNVQACSAGIP